TGRHGEGAETRGGPPHHPRAHRSTASTFATAWVAAGAVHVPVAARCHDSNRPAPRSTGNAAIPYSGTWSSANAGAETATAMPTPQGSSRANRTPRKNASSATAAPTFNVTIAALTGSAGAGPAASRATRTASSPTPSGTQARRPLARDEPRTTATE